jgi:hypothetical protein
VKKKKDDDGPVSDFAKQKSIRQQREFLPIFSVRDELLNVVRENAVVVIVGYVALNVGCKRPGTLLLLSLLTSYPLSALSQ